MSSLNALRRKIVQLAYDAGEGHIASALSILDVIWVLYDRILRPEDRFILSKGHGCLALYVVLAEKGVITQEQLMSYLKFDGALGGHPDRNKVSGVLCSTGSLGHGLPQAIGIALAKKIKGEAGRVYCLVGDGECNEGSIWEACLLAAHHRLSNLTVVVDYNHSTDRALNLSPGFLSAFRRKFEAFDFRVYEVKGHDEMDLIWFLDGRRTVGVGPIVVIADTIKGFGCERMSHAAWHHRVPTAEELPEILKELA